MFQPYEHHERHLGHLLEQIQENLQGEGVDGEGRRNVLRQSTLFLDAAVAKMSQTGQGGKEEPTCRVHTDEFGQLLLDNSLPALGRGYQLTSEIGQGTFSRIFKSTTPSSTSYAAIKACKADFRILGLREACFLSYFASKTPYGSKHFVGLLDTFM